VSRMAWLLRRARLAFAADIARAIKNRPCAGGHGHLAGTREDCSGCDQAHFDIATVAALARQETRA
jgi:hypothetical protein